MLNNWKRFMGGALMLTFLTLLLSGCGDIKGAPGVQKGSPKAVPGAVVGDNGLGVAGAVVKLCKTRVDGSPDSANPMDVSYTNQNGEYILYAPADYTGSTAIVTSFTSQAVSGKFVTRVLKTLFRPTIEYIALIPARVMSQSGTLPPVTVSILTDSAAKAVAAKPGTVTDADIELARKTIAKQLFGNENFRFDMIRPPMVAADNTRDQLQVSVVIGGVASAPDTAGGTVLDRIINAITNTLETPATANNGLGSEVTTAILNSIATYVEQQQQNTTTTVLPNDFTVDKSITSAVVNAQATVQVTVNTQDTVPPTAPTGLTYMEADSAPKLVTLQWVASPESDVLGYYVMRSTGDSVVFLTVGTVEGGSVLFSDTAVSAGTIYNYRIMAFDKAGNLSIASNAIRVTTKAPTVVASAPTTPADLKLLGTTTTQAKISWAQSITTNADGFTVPAKGYYVYRDGVLVATTAETNFPDTGLAPATSYTYNVKAFDADGNTSAASTKLVVNTLQNTDLPVAATPSAPTAVANDADAATGKLSISLSWNPVQTTSGTVLYSVYRDSTLLTSGLSVRSFTDFNVTPTMSYRYSVTATVFDSTTNEIMYRESALSVAVPVTAKAITSLDTKPTTPVLISAVPSGGSVSINWSASTNYIGGVAGYYITRNDVKIATVKTTSYIDTGVVAGNSYVYSITAFSTNGETSAPSGQFTLTIPTVDITDTTPPSAPTGLVKAAEPTVTSITISWTASPESDVAGYLIYRDGSQLANLNSKTASIYVDTSVKDNTAYTYTVKAYDGANNISAASNQITLSTLPAKPNTYSIFGRLTIGGLAVSGKMMTLQNSAKEVVSTALTDQNGNYAFAEINNGTYVIVPYTYDYYRFSPASIAVTVNGANVTGQNFAATITGSVVSGVTYPNGTIVGGITYPTGVVIGGVYYPTATVIGGVTYPTGEVIGGIVFPNGVVIGGVTYPAGTVVGGVAFPVGTITTGVSYPTGVVIGGVTYPAGTIITSTTYPNGGVSGSIIYPTGVVSGGTTYPSGVINGGVQYPTGTVISGIGYPAGTIIGGITYPTGTVIGGIYYPTATVAGGVTYPTGSVIGGTKYPYGVVIGGVSYPAGTVVGGIAFPVGTVNGSITFPTGGITGGATYPTSVITGGVTYPSGIVNGGVNYPAGTVIGGITYPTGTVVNGVYYPTATILNGVIYPTGSVIGGITYPNGVVIGGVSYPAGTVVGGIAFPAGVVSVGTSFPSGTVIGGITYPTGTIVNGVYYPTATVLGGVTYPTGSVIGGTAYPNGVVIAGVSYPAGTVVGGIAFPAGAVTTGIMYGTGSILGQVGFPTGVLFGSTTYPTGIVAGSASYPSSSLEAAILYPAGTDGTLTQITVNLNYYRPDPDQPNRVDKYNPDTGLWELVPL